MLALSHDEALIDFEEGLYEEGGPATYVGIETFPYNPDTGSTPEPIETPHTISVLPIEAESGWIADGLASSVSVVFMASTKQIKDLGITIDAGEKITFNSVTYMIQHDMPYLAGKGPIGHRFICVVS